MRSILAAGAQAVRVVNNPAVHVKVYNWPTPDPVTVSSMQAAWATYHVTVAALIVGGFALFIALIALVVAIVDARNNSKQLSFLLEERKKVPELTITMTNKPNGAHVTVGNRNYKPVKTMLQVQNAPFARKGATSILVTISLPLDALTKDEFDRLTNPQRPAGTSTRTFMPIAAKLAQAASPTITQERVEHAPTDGNNYRMVSFRAEVGSVLFPGVGWNISEELSFVVPVAQVNNVLWTVRCQELSEAVQGQIAVPWHDVP